MKKMTIKTFRYNRYGYIYRNDIQTAVTIVCDNITVSVEYQIKSSQLLISYSVSNITTCFFHSQDEIIKH